MAMIMPYEINGTESGVAQYLLVEKKEIEELAEHIKLDILTLDMCREEQETGKALKLYTMKTRWQLC